MLPIIFAFGIFHFRSFFSCGVVQQTSLLHMMTELRSVTEDERRQLHRLAAGKSTQRSPHHLGLQEVYTITL